MIQQKEVAEQISQLMIDYGAKLNASVSLVQAKSSAVEFEAYRMAVGKIMAAMLLDVMNPLYQQHPELKPGELD